MRQYSPRAAVMHPLAARMAVAARVRRWHLYEILYFDAQ